MYRALLILAVGTRLVSACKPEGAKKCSTGKYYNCDTKSCVSCAVGSYAPNNNDLTECTSCEPGKYVDLCIYFTPKSAELFIHLIFYTASSTVRRFQDKSRKGSCKTCGAGQ